MSNEQPQVEYRQLGKSGLRVSVPILGAMSIGSNKWQPWVINEDEARALCDHYCERTYPSRPSGSPSLKGRLGPRSHDMGHGKRLL
jgi:hypothetical protein